jgi:sulfur-carrier protein
MMPYHLQTLAKIGSEVTLEIDSPVTHESIVDTIEKVYPMLRGTIRDHVTKQRRPLLRYFVCSRDVSHEPADTIVPDAVLSGVEPFIIWGAVAGG